MRELQVEVLGPAAAYRCRIRKEAWEEGEWTRKGVEEVLRGLKPKMRFEWEYDAAEEVYRIVAYFADSRSFSPLIAEHLGERKGPGGDGAAEGRRHLVLGR